LAPILVSPNAAQQSFVWILPGKTPSQVYKIRGIGIGDLIVKL